jgi:hypothetical protein
MILVVQHEISSTSLTLKICMYTPNHLEMKWNERLLEMKWKAFGNEILGHKTQVSKRLKCYVSKSILSTFHPSNECFVNGTLFSHNLCVYYVCVCVFYFFTRTKGQNPKPKTFFFFWGMGGDIICKRDTWWVYWLLIVYTLLLPWKFSTLIYNFFLKCWNFLFFKKNSTPPSNKKNLKENIEYFKKNLFGWNDFINYLFEKHFLKLADKVCSFFFLIN